VTLGELFDLEDVLPVHKNPLLAIPTRWLLGVWS
jgi:hypothetical protein